MQERGGEWLSRMELDAMKFYTTIENRINMQMKSHEHDVKQNEMPGRRLGKWMNDCMVRVKMPIKN